MVGRELARATIVQSIDIPRFWNEYIAGIAPGTRNRLRCAVDLLGIAPVGLSGISSPSLTAHLCGWTEPASAQACGLMAGSPPGSADLAGVDRVDTAPA
ncbi:hypothetical protein GXW83_24155 [Streptacidiphilus sp. PB12-B1b]|uniref:hypothetical protein n=1 Tax=Streptacidiphilus sp. PB12-B1b TaxID=2705012 RepID=UPI0015FA7BFB|nr:hypothetical protein [Streptacidiphilus sp. PB12-B1b]QMU78339.1 hypothetical protein GXW83_24155 [Streptacidiphilus sp. PB12-B1b]